MRVQVGSVVVEKVMGGNIRIGTSHAGGIIDVLSSGERVVTVQRADAADLVQALSVLGHGLTSEESSLLSAAAAVNLNPKDSVIAYRAIARLSEVRK